MKKERKPSRDRYKQKKRDRGEKEAQRWNSRMKKRQGKEEKN